MSAHLPQPAQFAASYSDASAYLGVAFSSSLQHPTHPMVHSEAHFPAVQNTASLSHQQQFMLQQQQPANLSATSISASSGQAELNADELNKYKEAIYAHPLFPLLELLLLKCEQATTTSSEQEQEQETGSSANYTFRAVNDEIAAFAEKIQTSFPYYAPRPDVDTLMVQAVQTLRFHLMELEKVHELCHSFCERYVACLKGKMPMDLSISSERDFSTLASASTAAPDRHAVSSERLTGQAEASPDFLSDPQMLGSGTPTTPSDGGTQDICPFEFGGFVVESSKALASSSATASGMTTMTVGHDQRTAAISGTGSDVSHEGDEEALPRDKSKTRKRGIFPKSATNVMKAWLFQHLAHPYPSEEQKRQLSQETGLTILQVNNWFINARRRIVQPMIDASNRAGKPPVLASLKLHGGKTHEPGSPSAMPMTGMPHLPSCHPMPPSPSMPINREDQFMAPSMMPQAAVPHHAVMPMTNVQPSIRQDTNTHLPPLHLQPQGIVSGQANMIHAGIPPPAIPQTAYPAMMPTHGMPVHGMPAHGMPVHGMPPQPICVGPQPQPMMQAPALAMMSPPPQALPANTLISPTHTITSPPGTLVPMSQSLAQHNVVHQGYMVASRPHLTYYPETTMFEYPHQQQ